MWSQLLEPHKFLAEWSPNFFGGSLLVNMFSALCVVALGLMSSAGARGRAPREGGSLSGLHRLHGELGSDEEPHSLERSELSKRSAGLNGQTCTALAGVESSLHNNTHTVSGCFCSF